MKLREDSGPVVGMAGDDLLGAVDLFQQHGAHHHVWPGHGAEGDDAPRPLDDTVVQPLGAADHEGELGHAFVSPHAQKLREILAGNFLTTRFEGHHDGAGGTGGFQQPGFAALQFGWMSGVAYISALIVYQSLLAMGVS